MNAAKTISLAFDKPLVMVNHIHGHIYANRLVSEFTFPVWPLLYPADTELILMKDHFEFEKLGETLDDAVGEAYDKVARVVEVGYQEVRLSTKWPNSIPSTLCHIHLGEDSYDFSFRGLSRPSSANHKLIKTAKLSTKRPRRKLQKRGNR